MFYGTSSSWYEGDRRMIKEMPEEASLSERSSETAHQSEWLGWDGWVNPEPARTMAQDVETAA